MEYAKIITYSTRRRGRGRRSRRRRSGDPSALLAAASGMFKTIQLSDQRSESVLLRHEPRADREIALPENYGAYVKDLRQLGGPTDTKAALAVRSGAKLKDERQPGGSPSYSMLNKLVPFRSKYKAWWVCPYSMLNKLVPFRSKYKAWWVCPYSMLIK